jgi:hypothetical protein
VKELVKDPEHHDLRDLLLNDVELHVLDHIRKFLWVFDCTQQIVSSQTLPTLPLVLSVFDTLITSLNTLKVPLSGLNHVINTALKKLEEYRNRALETPAYVIAMCKI